MLKRPTTWRDLFLTVRRLLTGSLATVTAALAMNVATASASDLLVLSGDPAVTLSGGQSYGIVYVDGELRLTGDTTINAASIYFGPDARIDTCYVPGAGDGQCVGGRSLALHSSGPLTVATGIDLESGVTNGAGGSLSLSGRSVAVAGQINTSGDNGYASGSVMVSSSGPVGIQGIFAPGAAVSISGHQSVLVGNTIQTQGAHSRTPGDPLTRMQAGGPVTINANGGEVDVDGAISTQGQSAPGGGGSGGAGGAVTISGASVHAESIATYGGNSQEAGSGPGPSNQVRITAPGAISVSGTIDTSGASGPNGAGVPGAAVGLKSSGAVAIGAVDASGGPASAGGPITVLGATVSAGDLNTSGGGGSSSSRSGATAAPISITAPQGAALGALLATGGNGDGTQIAPAFAGPGGPISVVSSAGSISAGRVETEAGNQGVGPGNNGGPIQLKAADNLSVAGDVRTDGSSAGGNSAPPWSGGHAGSLFIAADSGTMNIGGGASAEGGTGSGNSANNQLGGVGGAGGRITLIAHAIGVLASLSAAGGSGGGYGNYQGPGGAGGSITAYTDSEIFNSQRLVSTDGGDGNSTGAAGNHAQNSSPTGLHANAKGAVSFTAHSPGATRYELETVGKHGATKVVEKTRKVRGLHPHTPICKRVRLQVVAVSAGVAWTSDASGPIKYIRRPSGSRTCAGLANLTPSKKPGKKRGARITRGTPPPAANAPDFGALSLGEVSPDHKHRETSTVKVTVSA